MKSLEQRVRDFLNRPLPDEVALHYEPDSLTEVFLNTFVQGQPLDAALVQMGKICLSQMDQTIAQVSTEPAREYFIECRKLLTEVLQTVM
ncbi:hypothetical protein [Meiothermus sp.]|uniref:hypothetical protein n=1 Tax=Meiothermus sp. TaxID=1955249 RepID=UPI0021DC5318|nr:hypothetical protein [Meiothermus sp.]GIW33187.1 MAG: hypothetical protein KatS3mg072_0520 [Meiothermus sp.]GIW37412.1 MAG: hypothetical protein KatS3mg073_1557 [Meiothermus sp.]